MPVILHVCKTSVYLLSLAFTLYLCSQGFKTALQCVPVGIAIAGIFHIVVSIFGAHLVSYVLCLLVVPLLFGLMVYMTQNTIHDEAIDDGPAFDHEYTLTQKHIHNGNSISALVIALVMIAVSSVFLLYLHSHWLNIQDRGSLSATVKICAGAGMLIAANGVNRYTLVFNHTRNHAILSGFHN